MSQPTVSSDLSQNSVDTMKPPCLDQHRLVSLDVGRGFALTLSFISGPLVPALKKIPSSTMSETLLGQLTHVPWDGVSLTDVGWPAYLFMTGLGMNFSLTRRIGRGESKQSIFFDLVRKSFFCALFAFFLDGGFSVPLGRIYFPGIFFRYALTILIVGITQLVLGFWGIVAFLSMLIVGYSVAMAWGTYSCFDTFYQTPEANLDFVVQGWFGGSYVITRYVWFFPRTLIAPLSGLLIARVFQSKIMPQNKVFWLAGIGICLLNVSWLMEPWIQINKSLWTVSYSLCTLGISCLILAAFYQTIDVWGIRRLAMPWIVFGVNPLGAWAVNELVPFNNYAQRAVGYAFKPILGDYNDMLLAFVQVFFCWLLFYWLYRRKIQVRL